MKRVSRFVALCSIVLFASCSSYKNVPYMQNIDDANRNTQITELYDARIMPKDLLTITVNTSDPVASEPFNLIVQANSQGNNNNLSTQRSLLPYLVDNNGEIVVPIIGTVHVGGLTKTEAEIMLRGKLAPLLKEVPVVTVRMANFKISVLGEVARPGQFTITNEKVNILEALALAGDMTIYGVRDSIKLVREDATGHKQIHVLNINDANIINSPYYQLQQNDVVYITPNSTKAKNSEVGQTTSLWFSATSILLSMASLLYNIFK